MATDESRRTWSLVIGFLIAFIVLAALAFAIIYIPRGPASTPSGPDKTSVGPSAEETGGSNATGSEGGAHAGGVSASTFEEVATAIEAAGIDIGSRSGLRMTTADSRRITVEGGGMTKGGQTVQVVRVERGAEGWQVVEAR